MAEYTDEQLAALIQSESDKRVTQALETRNKKFQDELAKAIADEREKVRLELEENAKLSAQEKADKELQKKMADLAKRENELSIHTNQIYAREQFANAGISKDVYEKMMSVLVGADADVTKHNVENFIGVFSNTKSQIETDIKKQYSNVKPPASGGSAEVTKDDFMKMGYAEKMKFKESNPELYKAFIKN